MPGKNICSCPAPPGGQVICESHQAAFCRVVNGNVQQGCSDPPDVSSMSIAQGKRLLDNWALSIITRIPRRPDSPILPHEMQILGQGQYANRALNEEIHFSLPWRLGKGRFGGGSAPPVPEDPVAGGEAPEAFPAAEEERGAIVVEEEASAPSVREFVPQS